MTLFAAFLRGVNVGGVNLKMAEVATALSDAGFTNVRTILATGNVLLESKSGLDTPAAVRKKAEAALRERFGYEAWVLAYDIDTVRAISEAYPFEREVDGYQSYVTFVTDAKVLDELAALPDRLRRKDRPGHRRRLLAGAQGQHPGQHDREDDGQAALQVVDHHPQPAHFG